MEVLERRLHAPIEEHPAVDFDALPFAQILGIADGRDWRAQVAGDFVADFAGLADLADGDIEFFKAMIGDGIGALVRAWGWCGPGGTFSFLLFDHRRAIHANAEDSVLSRPESSLPLGAERIFFLVQLAQFLWQL